MLFVEGETIGPYTLLEQLGQGGMATVYKAYHTTLDRYVAIKVLHLAFLEEESFLARFQREAKAVARLEHPNIVPIYDFSEHEGRPFLVMKYIEGETLKASLRRKKPSEAEIRKILKTIGAALDYAHQQGVLHRDVKPSNVLLAADGNIYLADYGLARIAQSGDVSLTTEHILGTPQYMSPEQAIGSDDLDGRTDLYSFGVLLYEMVTGQVPFNADTPFAIIHDHIYTPLPLPRQINPQVSEAVERVLLKALAKNKNDRYQSVAELVTAYEDAVQAGQNPLPVLSANPSQAEASDQKQTVQVIKPVDQKQKKDKKKKPWAIIIPLIVLGGVVVCFLGLAVLGRIIERRNNQNVNGLEQPYLSGILETPAAQEATLTPFQETVAVLQDIEPDQDMADQLLEDSIAAWNRANMAAARVALLRMYFASGKDEVFLQDAFQTMSDRGAWLLIAETLFAGDRVNAVEIPGNMRPFLHQVLYMAAEDPLSAEMFQKNGALPIFRVAVLRHQVLRGNIGNSKQELGKILDDPSLLKEFPEARLLEAEIFLKLGDRERALSLLENIMDDEAIPEWIWDMALTLSERQ